jgi:hypothetical protein
MFHGEDIMFASSVFRTAAAAAAVVVASLVAVPNAADARDRFSFGLGFNNYGASSFGFGYSTGGHWGHRGWGHRGWGRRGWGGDHLSLGFTYVVPPAYNGPRPYGYSPYYGAAPYGYPTHSYYGGPAYTPAGGVVVFPDHVRDRLSSRTRGVYYDAYRSALAAPIGESINWRDGRIAGDVTTTRDGWAGERYCREFRQNIVVDGRTEEAYGTACRNEADTDWEIIPN